MKLTRATITNFRRLDEVQIQFEDSETIFVGPNNSGKTSATSAFRCFLGKRNFKIYDFPLAKLRQIDNFHPDTFDAENDETHLPFVRLELWFTLNPAGVEYSRVASLLSDLNENTAEVGISCTLSVADQTALWRDYLQFYPIDEQGAQDKSLSTFLEFENRLKSYFAINFHALKKNADEIERIPLSPAEGKRTLHSLLRVDFVDAQRNMQDDEETSRGSKLSAAFGAFYRANVKHADAGEEAVKIVEENNARLTEHYGQSFSELMGILKGLGVPSANERDLTIVSTLSAEEALKGTTDLFYVEPGGNHTLPEAYNGLGFKNLVLMAIQVRDYQMQWANTEEDRPLCHVIFVEEPEVHLHAQVQQTFISNMWTILNDLAKKEGIGPQLVVTTHSSHILNSVDFEKVRYFRRCRRANENQEEHPVLSISEVHNLRDFQMPAIEDENEPLSAEKALNFLKRYLSLTHCDLMFADAAILIEGTVERLLLPAMIQQVEPGLSRAYLTVLEVGGAYAHVFAELMEFLHIPYLVITDIDSVKVPEGGGKKKACCAIDENAVTSNGALKAFFKGTESIADLKELTEKEKNQEVSDRFVAFQIPIEAHLDDGSTIILHGRTLEEAFIYENLIACQEGGFLDDIVIPDDVNEINQSIFELVKKSTFKKTEFALRVLAADDWNTPAYIAEGVSWLATRLKVHDEEAPIEDGA